MTSLEPLAHIPAVNDAAATELAEIRPAMPARRRWSRAGWAPIALGVALVARMAISRVLHKVGHPGAALDDAYIHFQYARAFAEGHPFRFQSGEPATSGGTSVLWPMLLAPFWLVGFRDDAILWPAWILSFASLGALAYEAWAITRRLAGDAAAIGAAAAVIVFPAFTWFAASGMEVVPFAWVLARAARRASEWVESAEDERSTRQAWELAALAWAASFLRPEGAVASVALAGVLALAPRVRGWKGLGFPLAALAPVGALPLLLWATTGAARSSTATVKLLPGNPYYAGHALTEKVLAQARDLAGPLLDGGPYSQEFLPSGGAWVAFAGLMAIAVLAWRSGRLWRGAMAIGIALMMFVPCAYYTFLWNRLRYLWPFATGWIIGLACLARLAGDAAGAIWPRARVVTPILCGAFAGMFFLRMDWAVEDVAQSASGIDRQQVALGRWARESLPSSARIGLNDTGAIAYFGERKTFDVVGLTTRTEGRYWVAGEGSRLEHYERLKATNPGALPTHFIVYPEWFRLEALLGEELYDATVTDASILGGATMRAYVANYDLLGSGEEPWTPMESIVDAVDVADLESEANHHYELLGARDFSEIAGAGVAPDGRTVLDGGRRERLRERFVVHLHPGERTRGIVRAAVPLPTPVRVEASGKEIGLILIEPGGWVETAFEIPGELAKAETPIDLVAGGELTTFHYWFGPAL